MHKHFGARVLDVPTCRSPCFFLNRVCFLLVSLVLAVTGWFRPRDNGWLVGWLGGWLSGSLIISMPLSNYIPHTTRVVFVLVCPSQSQVGSSGDQEGNIRRSGHAHLREQKRHDDRDTIQIGILYRYAP